MTRLNRETGNILLVGDFDCPNNNWDNHTTDSSGKDNSIQQSLIDIPYSGKDNSIQQSLIIPSTAADSLQKQATCYGFFVIIHSTSDLGGEICSHPLVLSVTNN